MTVSNFRKTIKCKLETNIIRILYHLHYMIVICLIVCLYSPNCAASEDAQSEIQIKYKDIEDINKIFYDVIKVPERDVLNIRELPNHQSNGVGEIPHNAKGLEYLGHSRQVGKNLWVYIRYQTIRGWVNKHYLVESKLNSFDNKENIGSFNNSSSSGTNTSRSENHELYYPKNKKYGYQIQIFASEDSTVAFSLKEAAEPKFNKKAIIVYEEPYYKIRFGNFISLNDAKLFRKKAINEGYNGSWIVDNNIAKSELPNNIEFEDNKSTVAEICQNDIERNRLPNNKDSQIEQTKDPVSNRIVKSSEHYDKNKILLVESIKKQLNSPKLSVLFFQDSENADPKNNGSYFWQAPNKHWFQNSKMELLYTNKTLFIKENDSWNKANKIELMQLLFSYRDSKQIKDIENCNNIKFFAKDTLSFCGVTNIYEFNLCNKITNIDETYRVWVALDDSLPYKKQIINESKDSVKNNMTYIYGYNFYFGKFSSESPTSTNENISTEGQVKK